MNPPALETNLRDVFTRIQQACEVSGRQVSEVTLVAVTKSVDVGIALELEKLGVTDFGENRFPSAEEKRQALHSRVHFIGSLQTNKVNKVVGKFDVLHSLDRPELIEAVNRRAGHLEITQKAFMQVNVSGEQSKSGYALENFEEGLALIKSCQHIELLGLMTMAPFVDDRDQIRSIFKQLKSLADAHGLRGLSMGMSHDFEIAVEEGATCIRVGSALFQ